MINICKYINNAVLFNESLYFLVKIEKSLYVLPLTSWWFGSAPCLSNVFVQSLLPRVTA